MNLRSVHAMLILFSAALAVLFGLWCLDRYGREDGVGSLSTTQVVRGSSGEDLWAHRSRVRSSASDPPWGEGLGARPPS